MVTVPLVGAIFGFGALAAVFLLNRGLAPRGGWLLVAYLLLASCPALAETLQGQAWWVGMPPPQSISSILLVLQLTTLGLLTFFSLGLSGRLGWLTACAIWLVVLAVVGLLLPGVVLPLGQMTAMLAVALAGWMLFSAGLLLALIYAYLTARLPLHANRVLFWTLALLLCLVGQALPLSTDALAAHLGVPIGLVGATGLTYAVLRHRLFDVRDALRRGIGYLLSTIIVACVVLMGLLLASQFLTTGGSSGVLGVALVALLLAFMFQPLWNFSQRMIQRYVLGERSDQAMLLRDYSQAIGEILDVEQLATAAVGIISEVLEVRRGALLLVTLLEDGDFRLRPVRGMGQLPQDERYLRSDSLVMQGFCETRGPLLQYDIDLGPSFHALEPEERDWWHNLAMDVYVPIMGREVPIGILALGPKGSGESYRPTELELLGTLAGQTAVALKNARMFGDLRQLNTEVNGLNEDLKSTNERLQQLDQVKSDFITIASHELRTPLTQVKGYTDILLAMNEEGGLSRNQVTEIGGSLSRASDRLEQVINAMLDVSQIDVQGMAMHFIETSIDTVLRFAIEKLAPAMRERKQTLTVRGVIGLPVLYADFQRLTQALSNVLTNAIKFTPDGGKISITGQQLSARGGPGDFIEVVVADTGVGIDPKDQELIFEKFYRVGNPTFHSTGATKFMGAGPGLGLPIARGVVEAHGGRLWVESSGYDPQTYPGSAFHIVLPLRPPAMSAEAMPSLESGASRPAGAAAVAAGAPGRR